jgi:hypothetical protein
MGGSLAIARISLTCLPDVTKQRMFLLAIVALQRYYTLQYVHGVTETSRQTLGTNSKYQDGKCPNQHVTRNILLDLCLIECVMLLRAARDVLCNTCRAIIVFLDILYIVRFLFKTHNVSEIGFCLRNSAITGTSSKIQSLGLDDIRSKMHAESLNYSLKKHSEIWGGGDHVYRIVENRISRQNDKKNGALVRQRTIPTERPLLIGEVSANFSG